MRRYILDFCGLNTPQTARRIVSGAKSSRQRLWPLTPCRVWGNSAHDSSIDGNHRLLPSRTASKHIQFFLRGITIHYVPLPPLRDYQNKSLSKPPLQLLECLLAQVIPLELDLLSGQSSHRCW